MAEKSSMTVDGLKIGAVEHKGETCIAIDEEGKRSFQTRAGQRSPRPLRVRFGHADAKAVAGLIESKEPVKARVDGLTVEKTKDGRILWDTTARRLPRPLAFSPAAADLKKLADLAGGGS